jgi:hypothetical protein
MSSATLPTLTPNPLSNQERERLYTLAYRQGSQVKEKHFPFNGKLGGAIERGKLHCNRMGIKFVVVRPFVVDLDYQERLKFEGREDYTTYE